MKKPLIFTLILTFTFSFAQLTQYYQQQANYVMDIDVDAANFTYQGKQTITYTNNSPDELKVVYFNLYFQKSGGIKAEFCTGVSKPDLHYDGFQSFSEAYSAMGLFTAFRNAKPKSWVLPLWYSNFVPGFSLKPQRKTASAKDFP